MNILSYFKFGNWGDTIGKYWVAEYIADKVEGVSVYVDPREIEGNWNKWIQFPYAQEINVDNIDIKIDYHIATHHRHWWWGGSAVPAAGPPLYFDLHGFNFRMAYEDWYPKLHPTDYLLEQYNRLGLPEKYNVVHLNGKDLYDRNKMEPQAFWTNYSKTLDKDIPIVSTGVPVDPANFKFSTLPGWLKLYVMYKAENLYGAHTGFTSIASIYRGRKNSFLVNYDYPRCLFLGPPVIAFGNCFFNSPDYKKLYYMADFKFDWSRYVEFNNQDHSIKYFINESQYPSLKFTEFNAINDPPESYDPLMVDFGRENCLVPGNTQFTIDDNPYISLLPNNMIAWGGQWFGGPLNG